MRIISHRGNVFGPDKSNENRPAQLEHVIKDLDLDVEIDLWSIDKDFYLGHDEPTYHVPYQWLYVFRKYCWIHCKNLEAMTRLVKLEKEFNFFWHQEDTFTLTSSGFIWTYPFDYKDANLSKYQVILDFSEKVDFEYLTPKVHAVCVDFLGIY